jgi:hypothetical protein
MANKNLLICKKKEALSLIKSNRAIPHTTRSNYGSHPIKMVLSTHNENKHFQNARIMYHVPAAINIV